MALNPIIAVGAVLVATGVSVALLRKSGGDRPPQEIIDVAIAAMTEDALNFGATFGGLTGNDQLWDGNPPGWGANFIDIVGLNWWIEGRLDAPFGGSVLVVRTVNVDTLALTGPWGPSLEFIFGALGDQGNG